mmetsp:Transcript_8655/g.17926  ORF Transcript_8655/g.17926 Transcript_8655/m.17926 type:complete len:236 (+) Transcript_8655:1248-1955(+)
MSTSSGLSISYPKPKQLIVPGKCSCFRLCSFKLSMITSLSSVSPSVRSMTCWKRSLASASTRASRAHDKPCHIAVPGPNPIWSRTESALLRPSSFIAVNGRTVDATLANWTIAKRSLSVKLCMIVRTACFATSSMDRPLLSALPFDACTVASMLMDHEMSMTQQMSQGMRSSQSGMWTETSTGRSSTSPSSGRPGKMVRETSFGALSDIPTGVTSRSSASLAKCEATLGLTSSVP